MNETFDTWLEQRQVAWRATHVSTSLHGTHARQPRPWILPEEAWEQGLWPGIRSGTPDALPDYLNRHGVQRHTGANNLKSSWVLCANLYFPFRSTTESRDLLAAFLCEFVAPEITSLDTVELEYSEDGALHPSELLGERGGSRGSGQTSPDVAFLVNGHKGLILTESKLAEHSFYSCSARTTRPSDSSRPANPAPHRCENALAVLDSPTTECHQVTWGRKYWQHLRSTAVRDLWQGLASCPAARAGYQLFRQQALAEGIAFSGKYDFVVSCAAVDERNNVLAGSLAGTGVPSIQGWGALFQGRARFKVFKHQQWVAWVRTHDSGQWTQWRSWIEARYGLA